MDRTIRGEGSSSRAWLDWLSTIASVPTPLIRPSLRARVVVVAPHPDDEVLTCAGLIRRHVAAGGSCRVMAVTDGEASHGDAPDMTPNIAPDRLRSIRQSESHAGLAELGINGDCVQRLGLPDGKVTQQRDRLRQWLSAGLRPTDCVVTTWRLDGHPDHEATGECAAETCRAIGCQLLEAPVWMWHWAQPGQAGIPWHRLRALALDGADIAAKRDALACHVSQLTPRDATRAAVLGDRIRERAAWPHEYYFVDHPAGGDGA